MHDQAIWEIAIEFMCAMLKNPNINIGDINLATIAVNHAERMADELNARLNQGLN